MPTATYADYIARHPESTAAQETVEAFLEDVAAEIAARCVDAGTTYDALAASREAVVRRVECAAVYRMCGRRSVDGVDQSSLSSFSQTVGDHTWSYGYSSGNGNETLLDREVEVLGLKSQRIGWLVLP